jgi:hypothetical protein
MINVGVCYAELLMKDFGIMMHVYLVCLEIEIKFYGDMKQRN